MRRAGPEVTTSGGLAGAALVWGCPRRWIWKGAERCCARSSDPSGSPCTLLRVEA